LGAWTLVFIALCFLCGIFVLTVIIGSLRKMRKHLSRAFLNEVGLFFYYRFFQRIFFFNKELDMLHIAALCARNIVTFCYVMTCAAYMYSHMGLTSWSQPISLMVMLKIFAAMMTFAFMGLIFGDFLPRMWVLFNMRRAFLVSAPVASFFLILLFPFSFLFLLLSRFFLKVEARHTADGSHSHMKENVRNLIQETIATTNMSEDEKKLIESVVAFKDRIVREVMIPRVKIFSLPASLSIHEAGRLSLEKGFSRIPVYKDNIDNIVGVLMYKDLLASYADTVNATEPHDVTIESILKPVLYTPETKKISSLLQEFRNKQVHLAIVVDEYGGTEGLVTIEDILEEIVGEIEDEYDTEEKLFFVLPQGGWIVDARMSILDAEEELGIKIPQDGEYDTIGGYIFRRAGVIPPKGMLIHHDDFDLEIVRSNDRRVEKVKITPISSLEKS
jgi:putative hemolysin